jgi:hypothetical protein
LWGAFFVPAARADDLLITEFMADNSATLLDQDGEASDWIEIYNPGAAPVDLQGWFLTDTAADPRKWRFPAQALDAGRFLVVFASGKDRAAAGAELHTNFKLSAGGEYLALIKPDGLTVAMEFAPAFPAQRQDVSFGLGQKSLGELVPAGSPARVLVPAGPALGLSWTGSESNEPFNDSAAAGWADAATGIGYPGGAGVPPPPQPIAYWDFDRNVSDATGNGHEAILHGASFIDDAPPKLGTGQSLDFDGIDDYVSAEVDVSETSYSLSLWFKTESQGRGLFTVVDGDLGANGYDRLLYLNGGNLAARVWNNEMISTAGKNYADRKWHHVAHVVSPAVGGQRLYVDGQLAATGAKDVSDFNWQQRINVGFSNDAPNNFFDGLVDDVAIWDDALTVAQIQALAGGASPLALAGYAPWIGTDVSAQMLNVNATAYIRIPFEVELPLGFDSLQLHIRYDDGFVAYLNGVEVARRNAPAATAFNSAAASDRPAGQAIRSEEIDLEAYLGLLRPGENILAIHGLNFGASSPDFLILPELLKVERRANRYMSDPTPGAPNVFGVLDFVADTRFSADRGFYTDPLSVEITTETAGAQIYYTTDGSVPGQANPAAKLYANPIPVAKTTTLRAAAFKEDFQPTNVDTHTYIFPALVARQPASPPGFPSTWSGGFPADYGVDPDVVNSARPGYGFEEALLSIPSVSITTDPDGLFGAVRGIYYNPQGRGLAWERAASIELIEPDGSRGFQVDAGIRMHGNSSRDHGFTPKHPFRIRFRREYGAAKLKFPLFEETQIDSFDELLLRGASTDSWPVVEGGAVLGVQRWSALHATYMRDQWMRDSQIKMGHPSGDGIYVHLYLNGLYWGLYDLAERPTDSFNAERLGGEKEEYDVIKDFAELESGNLDAWNAMISMAGAGLGTDATYQRIQGNNPDGTRNPAFPVYLDVDNLIDYMILHIYSGAEDWPHHNWWGARRRGPESQGFKFFVWDQEISNDSLVRTHTLFQTRFEDPVSSPSPSFLYGQLMANASFRRKFMDKVHKHLFNDGLLTPQASSERWMARQAEIDRAIVGESARWGDSKRAVPYKREVEWLSEQDWMRDVYWAEIHPIAVERFRRVGLYPDVEAPSFKVNDNAQHGGYFASGDRLTMTVPVAPKLIEIPLVTAGSSASALVPSSGSLGSGWLQASFVEGARGESWKVGSNGVGYESGSGYESVIKINVGAEMTGAGGNNSVYVRLPFTIPDQATLGSFDGLTLKMLYDDGFVAYLNGVKVAEANAPAEASLAWSSAATTGTEANLSSPSRFDIGGHLQDLRVGPNLLAIQGLNFNTSSSDMLIVAELSGERLDTTAPLGTIFYTTDGRDPTAPGAPTYAQPIALEKTVTVKARSFDGAAWSALNEAIFVDRNALPLRITEVMYHPGDPPPGSPFAADDLDFIELQNTGSKPLSLFGIRLEGGVEFDFSTLGLVSLPPGGYVLLLEDLAAFKARYDTTGMKIAGEYAGKLSNRGEPLALKGPLGETLLEFRYDEAWFPETDGGGPSLVIADALLSPESWKAKESWHPSRLMGGSPGGPEPGDGGLGGWQRPGDSNQDGSLDIADGVSLLLRLFSGSPLPMPCDGDSFNAGGNLALLDVNNDAAVNLSDVIHMLHYVFLNGPPPALGGGCARIEGCLNACAR